MPGEPRVAIVGGGPAGLMAAEVLAGAGAAVSVFEMHRSPGRKLLLAGRSGLNLTHTEPLDRVFGRYDTLPPALAAAIDEFPPARVRAWAEGLGQPTFVGSSGRLFPEAQRAAPLLRAWLARLADLGVQFRNGHRWVGWDDDALRFETDDGALVEAFDAAVIALGGASWPRVGSDGGWAEVFRADGIDVAPLRASNCGVLLDWSDVFVERFEGQPIKNVVVSWTGSRDEGQIGEARVDPVRGELVVTRTGLEGGPVYGLSGVLGRAADFPVTLTMDFAPDLDTDGLVGRLTKRRVKDSQTTWLRGAGIDPVVVGLLRESTGNRIPDDPSDLARLVKATPLPVTGLASLDRAISTAGGVRFDELDDQLMLRHRPGVFVAGEMLDWDAPTGGYLLQACFSTGFRAGEAATTFVGLQP